MATRDMPPSLEIFTPAPRTDVMRRAGKRLGRPYAQERPKAASRTMRRPSWYEAITFRACLTMSADRFRKRGIISYRRAIERTPPSSLRREREARALKNDGVPVILRGPASPVTSG